MSPSLYRLQRPRPHRHPFQVLPHYRRFRPWLWQLPSRHLKQVSWDLR
jgi:hypothetical protein